MTGSLGDHDLPLPIHQIDARTDDGTFAPRNIDILGVPISLVTPERAQSIVLSWAAEGLLRVVFVRDVHGLMRAVDDPELLGLHRRAHMVVPDGMPLTWVGRLRGHGREIGRTAGPDLVDRVCEATSTTTMRHFFYGGKPGVAEMMAQELSRRYPGLKVAGCFTPPIRDVPLNDAPSDEELQEFELIRKSEAHFVWVGLSSPKQERWMMRAAPHLGSGVLFGVGAAFDFHAGSIKRAPVWMRESGLEWLHRLSSEPGRLWRRYLFYAPRFVLAVALEQVGIKRADQ